MYKVAIPISNKNTNEKNRDIYAELFKKAKADRIFLGGHINEGVDAFKENLRYFKDQGFEVALWFHDTVGHGGTIVGAKDSGEKPKYTRLVDLDGNHHFGTYCPLDSAHRAYFAENLAKFASIKPDFIMLDDDFRLSQHGGVPCCCCELHMAKIREYCGEDITREELKSFAFTGKRNKYRDAFLRAQGESLELLAKEIRNEMDQAAPHCPVAVCSAYCSWDLDGTDPIRLTSILAGKNKKYLRLHGAPYWAPLTSNKPLIGVCEIARMFASFCKDEDIEIFSEGDTFRPRIHCPSSYLEIFDAALRADGGHDGILKYMLGYDDTPLYETGYIDRHVHNLPKFEKLQSFFNGGANAGVRVLIKPHLMNDADMKYSPLREQSPYPTAGILLSMNAIPTIYDGDGCCVALFGENARHFSPSEYKDGAILDGASAAILTELGIDVGLESFNEWKDCAPGHIRDEKTGKAVIAYRAGMHLMQGDFKSGISPVLTTMVDGKSEILAYKYENADGQRFLVFTVCTDALNHTAVAFRSYEVQAALQREIEWLAQKPLPIKTSHAPELYTLCKKGDGYTSVCLLNCFHDSVLSPVIELDREYSSIEFCNCSGRIEGNRVILDREIPVYDFVAFRAYNG